MASADKYKHYAAECVRVAQQIQDGADKTMLFDMAELGRRLAGISNNVGRMNVGNDEDRR